MKRNTFCCVIAMGFSALLLPSCDTATGQGAGLGAVTGAAIGAAATGRWEGAATGAAIGAGTGAIVGAAVDADRATRYGPPPGSGYPFARRTETPGFYQSPYPPHQIYNLRGVAHGAIVEDRVGNGYFRKP